MRPHGEPIAFKACYSPRPPSGRRAVEALRSPPGGPTGGSGCCLALLSGAFLKWGVPPNHPKLETTGIGDPPFYPYNSHHSYDQNGDLPGLGSGDQWWSCKRSILFVDIPTFPNLMGDTRTVLAHVTCALSVSWQSKNKAQIEQVNYLRTAWVRPAIG